MSVVWGDYRQTIRESVLLDTTESQWSNKVIYDCLRWSVDTFASHTAVPKEWVLNSTSNALLVTPYDLETATQFTLPEDMYESLDFEGEVSVTLSGKRYILDPSNRTPGIHPYSEIKSPYYYVFPDKTLNISNPIKETGELRIRYFAYYALPANEDDDLAEIAIPRWAEQPIAFLVGSYALTSYAIQSATIDRWKDKSDSGNPEQNALRKQAESMMKEYERGIARFPMQDRVNYFRQYTVGSDLW